MSLSAKANGREQNAEHYNGEVSGTEAKEKRMTTLRELLVYEANYGFLPQDHPATRFANARMRTLFPDLREGEFPDIRVLASTGARANAMAFSNWTVIITPEMIDFCGECREALDNVILHEVVHLLMRHHALIASVRGQKILAAIGALRFSEMEANMQAFYLASEPERDTNPLGAVWLAEKFSRMPEHERSWDLAHGDMNKEIIQYNIALRFLELFVEQPLRPIPNNVRESVKNLPKGQRVKQLLSRPPSQPYEWEQWIHDIRGLLQQPTPSFLKIAFPMSLRRYVRYESIGVKERRTSSTGQLMPNTEAILNQTSGILRGMERQWEVLEQGQCSALPQTERTVAQGMRMEMGLQAPILSKNRSTPARQICKGRIAGAYAEYEEEQTVEDNTLLHLPAAIRAIDFAFPQSQLFTVIVAVAHRCLGENMVFTREEDGPSSFCAYLDQSARALVAAQEAEERLGMSVTEAMDEDEEKEREPQEARERAWADVVFGGAVILQTEEGAIPAEYAAEAERIGSQYHLRNVGLQVHGLRKHQESLVELVKDRPGAKHHADAFKAYAEQHWMQLHHHCIRVLERLGAREEFLSSAAGPHQGDDASIATRPTRLLSDSDPETRKFLQEIASLMRSLPAQMVVAGEEAPPPFCRYSDLTKSGVLDHLTDCLHSRDILASEDCCRTLLRFAQAICSDTQEYGDALHRIFVDADLEKATLSLDQWNSLSEAAVDFSDASSLYGAAVGFDLSRWQFEKVERAQRLALYLLSREAKSIGDPEMIFPLLRSYLQHWKLPRLHPGEGGALPFMDAQDAIAERALTCVDMLRVSNDPHEARKLLDASFFISNPTIAKPLQEYATRRLMQGADFPQSLALLTREYSLQGMIGGLEPVEELVERKAQTPAHFEELHACMKDWRKNISDPLQSLGASVALEYLLQERMDTERKTQLLRALLMTGQDEQPLCRILADVWSNLAHKKIEQDRDAAEKTESYQQLVEWGTTPPPYAGTMVEQRWVPGLTAEYMRQSLYRLSPIALQALLIELLAGNDGMLHTPNGRASLISMLEEEYLDVAADPTLGGIIHDALGAAVEVASPHDLAIVLSQLLCDRILALPGRKTKRWAEEAARLRESAEKEFDNKSMKIELEDFPHDLLRSRIEAEYGRFAETFDSTTPESEDAVSHYVDDHLGEWLRDQHFESHDAEIAALKNPQKKAEAIAMLMEPDSLIKYVFGPFGSPRDLVYPIFLEFDRAHIECGLSGDLSDQPQREDSAAEKALAVLRASNGNGKLEKVAPLEFLRRFVPLLLTPGVRLCQLLLQSVDIPEEYKPVLYEIFDRLKGQSKAAAWDSMGKTAATFRGSLGKIGDREGGGSMYTVYGADRAENGGESIEPHPVPDFAVRVRNPNVQHHTNKSLAVIEKTLQALAEKDPTYRKVLPLIHIIRQWIAGELDDPAYESEDQAFRAQWDGWQPTDRGFTARIEIPPIEKTGTGAVRVDAFVPGRNLTEANDLPLEKRREYAALAVQFFEHVLGAPTSVTRTLSDISPGNFRITTGGNLALLDRGFKQPFSIAERMAIVPVLTASTNAERARLFVDWLSGVVEQDHRPQDFDASVIAQRIEAALPAESADLGEFLVPAMIAAFDAGLVPPLKYWLLFKNISALRHIVVDWAHMESLDAARKFVPKDSRIGLVPEKLQDHYPPTHTKLQ
ncbi:MAG: AarF/UbiB family protein [Candidatus Peregrinibacteria bacterium]|nr:AarF/UbiB family protein [Candidatus Peregrinibacteria bacterium]